MILVLFPSHNDYNISTQKIVAIHLETLLKATSTLHTDYLLNNTQANYTVDYESVSFIFVLKQRCALHNYTCTTHASSEFFRAVHFDIFCNSYYWRGYAGRILEHPSIRNGPSAFVRRFGATRSFLFMAAIHNASDTATASMRMVL